MRRTMPKLPSIAPLARGVTVERWPDGSFVIEHAVYHDGELFWRDRRWKA